MSDSKGPQPLSNQHFNICQDCKRRFSLCPIYRVGTMPSINNILDAHRLPCVVEDRNFNNQKYTPTQFVKEVTDWCEKEFYKSKPFAARNPSAMNQFKYTDDQIKRGF